MFRFENPNAFYGLIIIVLLYLFSLWAEKNLLRRKMLLGELTMIKRLSQSHFETNEKLKKYFYIFGILFLVIAAANPQWGTKAETITATKADIFIALDISNSMNAKDIAPSRLERAKKFVQSLINNQKGDRIGLILFAGSSYLQMPLSNDYAAAEMFVKTAKTNLAGNQGTAISDAIEMARKFGNENNQHQKALVIITDGEDHDEDALGMAKKAVEEGFVLFTVGIGTETGSFIPVTNNGREEFIMDEDGNPVKSKLNVDMIKKLAEAGNGEAYLLGANDDIIVNLKKRLDLIQKREAEQQSFTEYNSFFQYFLFLGILFLLSEVLFIRRKKILLFLLFIFLGINLNGQSAHSHLLNGDQLYGFNQFYEAEKVYRKAEELQPNVKSSYNLGNALYQQEKYKEAVEAYSRAIDRAKSPKEKSDAYHNLGNAHFNQEAFKESVEAYKNALKNSPKDSETINNLLKARQMLRQQQQQQQQDKDKKEKDQKEEKEQESSDDQQENSDQKNEDSKQEKPKENDRKLTKEEAEKLLDVIEKEDQKVHDKLKRAGAGDKPRQKDW